MAKYQTLHSVKRNGKRVPAGTFLTDLKKDEVTELKAREAIAYVPPNEEDEADDAKKAPPAGGGGKGGTGGGATA